MYIPYLRIAKQLMGFYIIFGFYSGSSAESDPFFPTSPL